MKKFAYVWATVIALLISPVSSFAQDSLSPNSGPIGTFVTATANPARPSPTVTMAGNPATNVRTTDGGSTITFVVGPGTLTANVQVNINGSFFSPFNVTAYTPAAPSITGIAPSTGPTAGGTSVVISGTNLNTVTGVTFGGVPAASFIVTANNQITAVSPAGTGVASIRVTTDAGTTPDTAADDFTYVPPAPIPTMSEWAMILLGLMLAGGAALYIQRRQMMA